MTLAARAGSDCASGSAPLKLPLRVTTPCAVASLAPMNPSRIQRSSPRPRLLLALLLFAVLILCGVGKSALAVELPDVSGQLHRPLEKSSARADVVIFILHDCPIANAFAPEISRLNAEFQPRGIRFFVVHVDSALATTDAQQHAKDFAFTCPVLLDRQHTLVARLKAAVTPEAFVVNSAGETLYRGRIDDRFVELGKRRQEPTRRDLRLALENFLAGKPVAEPVTKAIGCFIPTVKRSAP